MGRIEGLGIVEVHCGTALSCGKCVCKRKERHVVVVNARRGILNKTLIDILGTAAPYGLDLYAEELLSLIVTLVDCLLKNVRAGVLKPYLVCGIADKVIPLLACFEGENSELPTAVVKAAVEILNLINGAVAVACAGSRCCLRTLIAAVIPAGCEAGGNCESRHSE